MFIFDSADEISLFTCNKLILVCEYEKQACLNIFIRLDRSETELVYISQTSVIVDFGLIPSELDYIRCALN